ncbi:Anthranilate synthase component 2 [uncultured archaeon]|nr:Anthranilate synthase component 2 [uncultured archaeon]
MAEKKAVLVLSDGSAYFGEGLGAPSMRTGELVFNTGMTGYQEALTDPSYAGQILLMTYPLIGNYGLSGEWMESDKVHVEGFCVRQDYGHPHHIKCERNLDRYLADRGVPGISGLDTRALTRKIREHGVMPAALEVFEEKEADISALAEKARATDYSKLDFVEKVSAGKMYSSHPSSNAQTVSGKKVALIDCGVKGNIVRELNKRGCEVLVFPAFTKADEILSFSPDGILVSNGPGDPARLPSIVGQIQILMKDYPTFGICLGHQLLGWAAGSKTYKLKFGHRGGNHPVLDKKMNRVAITTQNHGFAVDERHLGADWEITHVNLNDRTNEGIAHKSLPIFSVQYHPEAHPGPRDSMYLFDQFVKTL